MVRKSTLEEKNKAMADLYLTLKPKTFKATVQALIKLRDADKEGFDRVLELFDENKRWVPPRHTLIDIYRKRYIDKDALNNLLSFMLVQYWDDQDFYQGGYHKHRLPVQRLGERDENFMQRYNSVYSQMMNDMLDVLKKLKYYETFDSSRIIELKN